MKLGILLIFFLDLRKVVVDAKNPRSCSVSSATVQFVTSCPSTVQEYKKRSEAKGCQYIGQDCISSNKFNYHCVLNSYGNASLEVCAPVLFITGFCTEYNTEGKVIQDHYSKDCTKYAEPCPSRYLSTEGYKYQQCFMSHPNSPKLSSDPEEGSLTRIGLLVATSLILIAGIILTIMWERFKNTFKIFRKKEERENTLPSLNELSAINRL
ncbi:uncharacterized protein LOC133178729 [Saccostrea echinata]|uniref:uncharacterized protein LOC133178729 n=1 Tax=Saccostrea echinata TaxID=191078 RepID=UPI002A836B39|nr:uncharacterized protein LOC133178729 [Saccostrea echinata]